MKTNLESYDIDVIINESVIKSFPITYFDVEAINKIITELDLMQVNTILGKDKE